MKYLFINVTAGYGSTGQIAREQCLALSAQGHRCVLAYGRMENRCPGVETVTIGTPLDTRLHGLRARLLDEAGFGSRRATRRFLEWVREYDPDVIWLHNLNGYYIHVGELFAYLRHCGKEIRWTLHDCWAFTGHCVYFDAVGCEKWQSGCGHCPQIGSYPRSLFRDNSRENFRRKQETFTGIPNLTLVVPSHWLEERVHRSFLGAYPVEVVYNTVDTSVFRPTPGDFRRRYGLEGKKILLGVASRWEERKGLGDFLALSGQLPEDYKIVLIGLTPKQIRSLPDGILGLPRTDSREALAEAYTAADLYLNPSREETFGMTTLEASCCGTRAVVYRGTACQEIAEKFGGLAVPPGAENLRRAVLALTGEEDK